MLLLCIGVVYPTTLYLKSFTFDERDALVNWKEMVLNREVKYELMRQGDEGFVQALSERACSALYYRLSYSLAQYPILKWKWRVVKFPDTSRAKTPQERDDYAARVYVIFPFLNFSSSKFIKIPRLDTSSFRTGRKGGQFFFSVILKNASPFRAGNFYY
jgi:hypothetical protein